jgi:hypothetical protein
MNSPGYKVTKLMNTTVNWTNSPGYKVAKLMNTTLQLPNAFNVPNTNHLIQPPKQHQNKHEG